MEYLNIFYPVVKVESTMAHTKSIRLNCSILEFKGVDFPLICMGQTAEHP
jgi:hypothetical protein